MVNRNLMMANILPGTSFGYATSGASHFAPLAAAPGGVSRADGQPIGVCGSLLRPGVDLDVIATRRSDRVCEGLVGRAWFVRVNQQVLSGRPKQVDRVVVAGRD